jgi:GNAT superfamily N-acetyltransferase
MPELDAALEHLPEMPTCSHELFRLLATNPARASKRFALIVAPGGEMIAVVGLRGRHRHWELLCDGAVPMAVAPAAPGRAWEALSALGVYLRLNEMDAPLPPLKTVRFVNAAPYYRIATRSDVDGHWKANGNGRSLKSAQNRCKALGDVRLEVDGPDGAEWIIRNWHEKWKDDPDLETVTTEFVLAAAAYLQPRGRYNSFRLLIDERPVAGLNMFPHDGVMHLQNVYRDPEFEWHGVGTRLIELMFRWAAQSPYEYVDLGCGPGYKARWAEEAGQRFSFSVTPVRLALMRQGLEVLRTIRRRGRALRAGGDITDDRAEGGVPSKQKLDNAV